jgi:dephospho-CoA kinase
MGHRDILEADAPIAAPFVLGGGIGAGKSTVLAEFERHGFVVIEADKVGHAVLAASHPTGRAVMARWPGAVVDGGIDRSKLASIVFSNAEELAELEALTHPSIRESLNKEVGRAMRRPGIRGVVIEIPLLRVMAETPWRRIAVLAPPEVRLARATARGADPVDVQARMDHQEPDEAWAEWADIVLDNGGPFEATVAQIEDLLAGSAG